VEKRTPESVLFILKLIHFYKRRGIGELNNNSFSQKIFKSLKYKTTKLHNMIKPLFFVFWEKLNSDPSTQIVLAITESNSKYFYIARFIFYFTNFITSKNTCM